MLKNRDKLNEEAVLELKNMINNMKIIAKINIDENNSIRSMIQNLITVKNDSENKNESNPKKAMEMNTKIENLSNLIKAESRARGLFNKDLEDRCSKIEAGVELIKNDSKNLHSEISKKINSPENKNIKQLQQKIDVAGNVPAMNQIDQTKHNYLEVKGQVETSINLKQHTTTSNSVLNYEHKDTNPAESQQLSATEESNIITSKITKGIRFFAFFN